MAAAAPSEPDQEVVDLGAIYEACEPKPGDSLDQIAERIVEFVGRCKIRGENGEELPFDLMDYQVDLIVKKFVRATYLGERFVIVKSRKMGVTWTIAACYLWGLLFYEGFAAFTISRKQDVTDDGGENSTHDSFFGKMRWIWVRLPAILRHDIEWRRLAARCAARDSIVVGESANVSAGRGSTFLVAFCDEFAHIDHDADVWASVSQAARGIIMASTPKGETNVFAIFCHDPKQPLQVVDIPYSLDPKKDRDWYEREAARIGIPEIVAQELDRSFTKSIAGRVYPEFSREHNVRPCLYDSAFRIFAGWDFGMSDLMFVAICQLDNYGVVRVIDEYGSTNELAEHYVDKLAELSAKAGRPPIHDHWGDIAGRAVNSRKTSWISDLRRLGIRIQTRSQRIDFGLVELRRRIIKGENPGGLIVAPHCTTLIQALNGYRRKPGAEEPVHDIHSHPADALRYAVVGRTGPPTQEWS